MSDESFEATIRRMAAEGREVPEMWRHLLDPEPNGHKGYDWNGLFTQMKTDPLDGEDELEWMPPYATTTTELPEDDTLLRARARDKPSGGEPEPEPSRDWTWGKAEEPKRERRWRYGGRKTEEEKLAEKSIERLRWFRADDLAKKIFGREKAAATVAEMREKVPPIISAREFIETTPDLEVRIDPLMIVGGRVLLAGSAKIGKSTMGLALANSLLTGIPFLGKFPVRPLDGSLVYVNAEMPDSLFKEWLESAIDSSVIERFKVWHLLSHTGFFDPRSEAGIEMLSEMLTELNTDLIVLDPLVKFLSALGIPGNSNDDVAEWLNGVDVVATNAGVEVVVVHHYGHSVERARGASALLGWPDHLWDYVSVGSEPEVKRYLKTGGRTGFMEASEVSYDPLTGYLWMEEEPGTRAGAKAAVRADDLLIEVEFALRDSLDGLTQADLLRAVEGRDSDILAVVRQAETDGLITITKDGHSKIHRWVE